MLCRFWCTLHWAAQFDALRSAYFKDEADGGSESFIRCVYVLLIFVCVCVCVWFVCVSVCRGREGPPEGRRGHK